MANDEERAEAGGDSRARAQSGLRVVAQNGASSLVPSNAEAAQSLERSLASALRARPGLIEKIVGVIDQGLDATKWTFDMVKKEKVYEPDWKERREMAKLALAYLEGLPVQTVIGASVGDGNVPRLADALRRSPNARRVLESFASRLGPVVEADQESPVESAPSAPSVAPAGNA